MPLVKGVFKTAVFWPLILVIFVAGVHLAVVAIPQRPGTEEFRAASLRRQNAVDSLSFAALPIAVASAMPPTPTSSDVSAASVSDPLFFAEAVMGNTGPYLHPRSGRPGK
ncbi:hypothetical protein M1432_02195 [Patescibacteria group bacterium]|nr:hypothetical protein [Patescibacteria group bacterium]